MSSSDEATPVPARDDGGTVPLSGTPNYSNAQNFLSHMNTGVDPRTGDFTCSFTLPALEANALQGPTLQLGLAFSAQLADNLAFGIGWALTGVTRYDPRSRILSLATGEQFAVSYDQGDFEFKDCKLVTFKMKRDGAQAGVFWVTHKNGVMEKLSTSGGIRPYAVPEEIRSPEGRSVHLNWTVSAQPRLEYIRDEHGEILTISYNAGAEVIITLFSKAPTPARFVLTLTNNLLASVSLPGTDAAWRLFYEPIAGMNYVREVRLPMGGIETINYRADGHKTLPGAPAATVPYVVRHARDPGQGGAPIVTTYTFSDRNYLGHQSGQTWEANQDNLYKMTVAVGSGYKYTSTATMQMTVDGQPTVRIVESEFNRLHLQTLERTTQNGHILEKTTVYYDDPTLTFAQQKPYFQLPKETRTRWEVIGGEDGKREEIVTTEYDDYGNLIRQVDETGLVEEREYYDIEGEAGACPPDPLGFKRSLKRLRAIPMAGRAAGAHVIETRYQYTDVASLVPGDAKYLVIKQEKKVALEDEEEIDLGTVDTTYITVPADPHFGRVKSEVSTLNGKKTTTTFTYTLASNVLTLDARITGHDNTTRHAIEKQSTFNGMAIFEEGEEGTTVAYEYDALGRVVKEVASPDSDYAAERISTYTLGSPSSITRQDVTGTRSIVFLDGLGREVRGQVEDVDVLPGTFRDIWTRTYDAFGDLVSETTTDWVAGVKRATLTTTHAYDHWGQPRQITHPDGSKVITEANPITLVEKTWMEDKGGKKTGSTVTHGNIFGKPDLIEYFTAASVLEAKESFLYDGIGRCVSATDRLGHETLYTYDAFDRLIKTTLPDKAEVTTAFAEHSGAELPVEIGITHASLGGRVSVGQQGFDGLSRRVTYTVGGRTITFGYKEGALRPATETTPLDEVITYEYEPALGMQLTSRTDVSVSTYDYDHTHGQVVYTARDGLEKSLEYFRSGQLKTETWKNGTGEERMASYAYSLAGRAQSYTNVFDVKQIITYDALDRPEKLQHEGIVAELKRDDFGRVISIKAWEGLHSMTTGIEYDDFGREKLRSFDAVAIGGDSLSQTLTMKYNKGEQLEQRTLAQGTTTVRDEVFKYDNRGHLVEFTCTGTQLPSDPWGKTINKQVFEIDAFDRILSITTTFPGGVNTTTYSYEEDDPAQLTRLTHSHADYPQDQPDLTWDAAGRVVSDERGRTLKWNAQNQLVEISAPAA